MPSRSSSLMALAAALALAAVTPWTAAQTNGKSSPPAQKTPAKPGAQSGPDPAASAASATRMSPPAEKKPAKPGAQSGPKASSPSN